MIWNWSLYTEKKRKFHIDERNGLRVGIGHRRLGILVMTTRCMSVLRIDQSELVTLEKPKKQDLVQDFFPDHMALWYVHSLCIKSWFFCRPHTWKTGNVELTVFMKFNSLISQRVPEFFLSYSLMSLQTNTYMYILKTQPIPLIWKG